MYVGNGTDYYTSDCHVINICSSWAFHLIATLLGLNACHASSNHLKVDWFNYPVTSNNLSVHNCNTWM